MTLTSSALETGMSRDVTNGLEGAMHLDVSGGGGRRSASPSPSITRMRMGEPAASPRSIKFHDSSSSVDSNTPPMAIPPRAGGVGHSGSVGDSPGGATPPKFDPKKSKKFLNHWKQAASMSKIGNRTKNLLRWKSQSQSVDIAGMSSRNGESPGVAEFAKSGSGSEPSNSLDANLNNLDQKATKTHWSEHVWTAWVHRGFSDEVTEVTTIPPGGDMLTDFQKDKFRYFFVHVLDLNSDYVISAEDFDKLNERIRHYMDWSVNSVQFLVLKEVHKLFLECFLTTAANFDKKDDGFDYWDPFKRLDVLYDRKEHVSLAEVLNDVPELEKKTCVTIDEWIDVWGTIVGKAKKLDDFPMWLQYYPKVLFDVINRTGTGVISKSELRYFYTAFMDVGKLGEQRLDEITNNAYKALTSGGDVHLTYHIYKLSFLNFLLGKQPNGPGQYIFGTVTPQNPSCMFPIDYSALNATEEDLEPFRHDKLEEKGSRRSVIV